VLSRIGLRSIALGLVLAAVAVAPAAAAPHIDGEFPLGSNVDTNNKIAVGPDGNIWVTVNDAEDDVARITPGGQVEEFNLELPGTSGITAGSDGNLWVTESGGVTKFSPNNPVGTKESFLFPDISGFHSIVTGADGNLWVATVNLLIEIPPNNPPGAIFHEIEGLNPRDIDVVGSQLVIADFNERIVTATTAGATTSHPIDGGSQGVAGGPGGQIAFSDPQASPAEQVGLITPPGAAQEQELQGDPFGVALGSDGAYWIPRAATNGVSRLTADGQLTFLGGFGAGMKPRQITSGPGNTLWVTLENATPEEPGKVGRISGLEPPITGAGAPPPPAAPDTKITKGPKKRVVTRHKRAKVKFKFSSSTRGVSFECALTKLQKKAKSPRPRFAACRSPKIYKLKPGRYRFEVRAVLGGVHDPTPARRAFRVIHRG
jgi:streptogramin lyase